MNRLSYFLLLFFFPFFLIAQDFSLLHQYRYPFFAVDHTSIWMGDEAGLFQIDKLDGTICGFYNASNVPALGYIQSIGVDRQGQLYVCADELLKFEAGIWISISPSCDGKGGIAFDENEQAIPVFKDRYDAPLNCVNSDVLSQGFYQLTVAPDGRSYMTYESYRCQGSSSGCGCERNYRGLYQVSNGDWDAYDDDDANILRLGDFTVDSLSRFWLKYENTNQLQISNSTPPLQFSTHYQAEALRGARILGFDSQGRLWLHSNTELFQFYDDLLHPVGPTGFELDQWAFDSDGSLYLLSDEGQLGYFTDSLYWLASELPFSKPFQRLTAHPSNGDHWLSSGTELWRIGTNDYEVLHATNSPLPAASPRLAKVNQDNDLLLYYSLDSDTSFWYKNDQGWTEYHRANWPIPFRQIEKIETDSSGGFWLFNAQATGDTIANFDGQQWQSYPDLLAYWQAIGFDPTPPQVSWHLEDTEFQRIENSDTTRFPIPDSLLANFKIYSTFNQDGHAWYFTSTQLDFKALVWTLWFDGQAWRRSPIPIFFNGEVKKSYTTKDSLWVFIEPVWWYPDVLPKAVLFKQDESVASHDLGELHPLRYIGNANFYLNKIDRHGRLWVSIQIERHASTTHITPWHSSRYFYRLEPNEALNIYALLRPEQEASITDIYWDENDQLWIEGRGYWATLDTLAPIPVLYHKNGICNKATRLVAANIQGGIADYSFQWNDGTTEAIRWEVPPGDYSVSISDGRGNSSSLSTTTTGVLALEAEAMIEMPSDTMLGSISVLLSGGTPPYTLLWEDGSTEAIRTQLSDGIYQLWVEDAQGCTEQWVWELLAPLAMELVLEKSPLCMGLADGVVEWRASGGRAPYIYEWNDGGNGARRNDLTAGDYLVTVSSAAGDSLVNNINLRDSIWIELESGWASTAEGLKAWALPSGGQPPYQWEWENGATTDTIILTEPGTIGVRISDANGCAVTTELEIILTGLVTPGDPAPSVFPNPGTGLVLIQWERAPSEVWSWEVWGLDQRLWQRGQMASGLGQANLNLEGLPQGSYWLRLRSSKKVWTIKWVKC